ncbi:MAG: hypothetical protein JOZ69_20940 [Myxococcales bacterium]|nr:hypothetical protein [Myxococcales bacterium]
MSAPIDRKQVAERIFALTGMGARPLARCLRIGVRTLDRLVVEQDAPEATYVRLLPRLAELEAKVAAYKRGERSVGRPSTSALFDILFSD